MIAEPAVASSSEVAVYASWAEILMRMTYCSVGKNPWTVVENKIHPAVAEPEFTRLNMPYMSRYRTKCKMGSRNSDLSERS
jgi:hypothetical protein